MGALRQAIGRIRAFFHKQAHDSELEAEVAAHLDLAIEENIARGMSLAEAKRQALLRFGGVQQAREHQRETRGLPWLDILGQDLRFTLRTLRRDRAFAIARGDRCGVVEFRNWREHRGIQRGEYDPVAAIALPESSGARADHGCPSDLRRILQNILLRRQ